MYIVTEIIINLFESSNVEEDNSVSSNHSVYFIILYVFRVLFAQNGHSLFQSTKDVVKISNVSIKISFGFITRQKIVSDFDLN